jgi:hypothetical protein
MHKLNILRLKPIKIIYYIAVWLDENHMDAQIGLLRPDNF